MIKSWMAWLLYLGVMTGVFIFARYSGAEKSISVAFFKYLTAGFAAYVTKRVIQKHRSFNGE
ncbi:MAG: hypothetical protein JRI41_06770 [Deltaproteobacteria bacterium]|nr:hypothetical protein [Deltaproteobacteria bacterium]